MNLKKPERNPNLSQWAKTKQKRIYYKAIGCLAFNRGVATNSNGVNVTEGLNKEVNKMGQYWRRRYCLV